MHPDPVAALTALGSKDYVGLETFEHRGLLSEVELLSDELTALCPVTGQPDLYTVAIRYWPAGKCLESKSVKLYLANFREEGVFCEDLAVEIKGAVSEALGHKEVRVTLTQKSRGGISITATA